MFRGDHVALTVCLQEPNYWPAPCCFTSAWEAANGRVVTLSALYPLVIRQVFSLIFLKCGLPNQSNLNWYIVIFDSSPVEGELRKWCHNKRNVRETQKWSRYGQGLREEEEEDHPGASWVLMNARGSRANEFWGGVVVRHVEVIGKSYGARTQSQTCSKWPPWL